MNTDQASEFIRTVPENSIVYWHFSVYDLLGNSAEIKYIVCPNDVKYIPAYIKYHCHGSVVNKTIAIIENGTFDYIEDQLQKKHAVNTISIYNGLQSAFDIQEGNGTFCRPLRTTDMKNIMRYVKDDIDRNIQL